MTTDFPFPEKPARANHPIQPLIRARWSPRAFDPHRPVERAKLLAILESARWAPSCFNEQPWRYIVFDEHDSVSLDNARCCLTDGNAWARKAPLLLLSVANEFFARNGKPNRHAQHDVGAASENLVLQAADLGLIAHQMVGFDAAKAKILFGIPDAFSPMAMIAVGYPGDAADLSEELQRREVAPRTRNPLREIAFAGSWGRGLTP